MWSGQKDSQRLAIGMEDEFPVIFYEWKWPLSHLIPWAAVSKQPSSLRVTGLLYLMPLTKPQGKPLVFCSNSEATMRMYMKTIVQNGGTNTDGCQFTNHSIWKTTARELQKAGISNHQVQDINVNRLFETLLAATDMEDYEKINNILSPKPIMAVPYRVSHSDFHASATPA